MSLVSYLCGASVVLLLVLSAAGCSAREDHAIPDVAFDRISWDSVRVDAAFVRHSVLGRSENVTPTEFSVLALNARYDTLYAGSSAGFDLDDAALGNGERVIVEVCGRIDESWVCTQDELRSSPKRVLISEKIQYPIDDTYDRGRFDFEIDVERKVHGGEGWEPIDFRGDVSGHMDVFVAGGEPDAWVRIPFTRASGAFDLRRLENYHEFRFHLDSRLMDHQEAQVHFQIHGGINGETELLASVEKTVSAITSEHRLANVQGFVRQVGRRLVNELSSFFGGRRAIASVQAWRFDHEASTYVIDMAVTWRGSFFDGNDYRLEGELTVRDDGYGATFVMMDGNRRGIERWNERFADTELQFRRLDVERPPERYRPGGGRLSAY